MSTVPTATGAPSSPPAAPGGRRPRREGSRVAGFLKTVAWPLLTVVVISIVWEIVSRSGMVNEIILPPPSDVAVAGWELMQESYFWEATWVTLQEALLGFLIGCAIAVILGTLITFSRPIRLSIYPLAVGFQNTPRVALAPLFLIWFGFGLASKVLMAAATCFFPVLIAVVVATETIDRDARTLMRSFGASRWETYRKLELPASLPLLFSGFKQAITFALIGAIVAEFVGGDEGLGVLITQFNFQLAVAEGFFVIVALMVIGLVLYGLIELIDRKFVFWRDAR